MGSGLESSLSLISSQPHRAYGTDPSLPDDGRSDDPFGCALHVKHRTLSQAQEAVKSFLQNQTWGVTGAAAATLLKREMKRIYQWFATCLHDPEEKVRVQAALILAMVGSDPSAVKVLQEAYPRVDRDMKGAYPGGDRHIGDPQSIPFLLKILESLSDPARGGCLRFDPMSLSLKRKKWTGERE